MAFQQNIPNIVGPTMNAVTIIFPHQLFDAHPAIALDAGGPRKVILVEDTLFFQQYKFHKQKLVMHRASMKAYEHLLKSKNLTVQYIECNAKTSDLRLLLPALASEGIRSIHYAALSDNWLAKRMTAGCAKHGLQAVSYRSPNFLNSLPEVEDFFEGKENYFLSDFYIWQRKQRGLLLEGNDRPLGGKWSFDADNRLRFPKNETVPVINIAPQNKWTSEAIDYINLHFPDNYGYPAPFIYPVTSIDAEKWLDDFLAHRFQRFGVYEDAIVAKEHFLYHSVLTPMLNIGLLQPQQIIDKALDAAISYDVPLNSLEGFLRQVMGWREFIHIVYEREGSRQRTRNYWGFTRKIPASFWQGTTGIDPVDAVVKKIIKTGYSHHIERLMVMGNFMLLCEFDPDEVYKWFMEMYVDSYDWVMVPNVYGMTQFADGGLMTTKPYISGSNYLVKMGDFTKGPWQQIWGGLFWRFMHVHRNFFSTNPRLGMLLKTFDKMPAAKQQQHLKYAGNFLEQLDKQSA
jgi:deoxyribodipyrimidine photolyase-related protein